MKIRNPRVGAAALIPDTRRTNGLALKAALVAGGVLLSMAAQAQTVVFDETFAAGLGKFTADGTVNTSSGAARLDGCYEPEKVLGLLGAEEMVHGHAAVDDHVLIPFYSA